MNRYIVSYYSEFHCELHQARLDAPDEVAAVLIFLDSINEKEAVQVLSDKIRYPDLAAIKEQLYDWDAAIAIMKL